MKKNNYTVYSIAKTVSYELLIEELLQRREQLVIRVLDKFIKRKYSIRINIIFLKIFNAFLLGILSIFPLIAYNEVNQVLIDTVPFEVTLLINSLIFAIFFCLQFIDFFLIGIFNAIAIMSGDIFSWLKTLPISKKKLSKIAILTIFRTFDLPLIVMTTIFPIGLLILTQNVILFLLSLGISFMNVVFSFFLLVIFGNRFASMINLHKFKSKKSFFLQLFNTFSYTIIIFGSILTIQITLSSTITFLNIFINSESPALLNLIFSLIPFPFNSSILISISFDPSQISRFLWINSSIGMGLYILLIVVIYSKAISTFEKIVSGKYKTMNRQIDSKKSQVIVKTKSPIKAFLRKDLIIASRSLKTFMSIIAPILFSFIFVFYYNLSYTGGEQIINWAVILGFSLITSGIIVHNITNIDISGKTIMTTLPIIPRDQAIAKLILIISVQTVSTVSPSLMYIFHSNFFNILEMLSGLLPLVYIFLLLIFLMKIKLFSKVRNHYVVEEISSDNKFFNWLKILILTYIIYFIIILVAFFVFYTQELQTFLLIISLISLISLFFLTLYFKSLFPKPRN
ncbi:MAG: hypothetical protein ACXACX_22045 [Candidatus Hodarchaeales archaeon]